MIGLWIEPRCRPDGQVNPHAGRRWFHRRSWAKRHGLGALYSLWVPEELASLFCGYGAMAGYQSAALTKAPADPEGRHRA